MYRERYEHLMDKLVDSWLVNYHDQLAKRTEGRDDVT
jgi:hypothetical protein